MKLILVVLALAAAPAVAFAPHTDPDLVEPTVAPTKYPTSSPTQAELFEQSAGGYRGSNGFLDELDPRLIHCAANAPAAQLASALYTAVQMSVSAFSVKREPVTATRPLVSTATPFAMSAAFPVPPRSLSHSSAPLSSSWRAKNASPAGSVAVERPTR